MKGKHKKNKQKPKTPPLSALDRFIYAVTLCISAAFCISLIIAVELVKRTLIFSDENELAFKDHISFLWCLPFFLLIVTTIAALYGSYYSAGKPIFGNKNVKYGSPPWDNTYPMFGKNKSSKKKDLKPIDKRTRKISISIWCACLAVFLCLLPCSLFGREALTKDNKVIEYNFLNKPTDEYTSENFASVIIRTTERRRSSSVTKYGGGFGWYRTFGIQIIMKDGSNYYFDYEDCDLRSKTSLEDSLENMIRLKNSLPQEITAIEGKESLESVIKEKEMNEKETKLLYELFEA